MEHDWIKTTGTDVTAEEFGAFLGAVLDEYEAERQRLLGDAAN